MTIETSVFRSLIRSNSLRDLGMVVLCIFLLSGCRAQEFPDGTSYTEDHILASRAPADGGTRITGTEIDQRFFVATDDGLDDLEDDLRTQGDLYLGVRSFMDLFAQGDVWMSDPLTAATVGAFEARSLDLSRAFRSINIREILKRDDDNPGELQKLCAHPLFGEFIPDSSCYPLKSLKDVPYDDISFDIDTRRIQVAWDEPRHVAHYAREGDDPGKCEEENGVLKYKCKTGFSCPADSSGLVAGECVWIENTCSADAHCAEQPACSAWGGCSAEGTTRSVGVCDVSTSPGRCTEWMDFDEHKSDSSPDAPVMSVEVPFNLNFDPEDGLGLLFKVFLNNLTVDFRVQPRACAGASCQSFDRTTFEDYVGSADARYSARGVDFSIKSRMLDSDWSIEQTGACSGLTLFLGHGGFGEGASICESIAIMLREKLPESLERTSRALGGLTDTLTHPTTIPVPEVSFPSWLSTDLSKLFYATEPVGTPESQDVAVVRPEGAWSDDLVTAFSKGARFSHLQVDFSGAVGAGSCSTCATGGPCPTTPFPCDRVCPAAGPGCDLTNVKFCLDLHSEDASWCADGFRVSQADFRDLATSNVGIVVPEAPIRRMFDVFRNATSPIPALPNLAGILEGSPFLATTTQRLFTEPLTQALGDAGTYSDILHCPETGRRPAGCPEGANGPVFAFVIDTDHDGIPDEDDLCPEDHDPANVNSDGDPFCDASDLCDWTYTMENLSYFCDCDIDGDGCTNELVRAPIPGAPASVERACSITRDNRGDPGIWDENPTRPDDGSDNDHDGLSPDGLTPDCDPDDDGDGHLDGPDNCPSVWNPGQQDTNEDRQGDACDPLCGGPGDPCPRRENGSPFTPNLEDFDIRAIRPIPFVFPPCINDGPGCFGDTPPASVRAVQIKDKKGWNKELPPADLEEPIDEVPSQFDSEQEPNQDSPQEIPSRIPQKK